MAKTVLVIGGAGYIGAHTCKALTAAGYIPVVFDNLTTGHKDFVRWGELVEGDMRDWRHVAETIKQKQASSVIHFAASAYVGESVEDPLKYYENNVSGTLGLLRGMLEAGCLKLVFSSTCAVYGEPAEMPIRENTPASPVNPYGASKLMCERILTDFGEAYELQSVILRYFNACGADPEGEIGEARDPETHLIPRAMLAILGRLSGFEVFGSDFETPDGTAVRDYVHVSDLAEAHVLALNSLLAGSRGGTFNLGTGRGYSVREVLDAITRETGRSLPAITGARRPGDPPILVADPTHAEQNLQFRPHLSDLETIVRTSWRWHSEDRSACPVD